MEIVTVYFLTGTINQLSSKQHRKGNHNMQERATWANLRLMQSQVEWEMHQVLGNAMSHVQRWEAQYIITALQNFEVLLLYLSIYFSDVLLFYFPHFYTYISAFYSLNFQCPINWIQLISIDLNLNAGINNLNSPVGVSITSTYCTCQDKIGKTYKMYVSFVPLYSEIKLGWNNPELVVVVL